MPYSTYTDSEGVEWDVVQIPALRHHGNRMLMDKSQGCWELDYSDSEVRQAIATGWTHEHCVQGVGVQASMVYYDKVGIPTGLRKVRVTPLNPDRIESRPWIRVTEVREGQTHESRVYLEVEPGSVPGMPSDYRGLPLPDGVSSDTDTQPRRGRFRPGRGLTQQPRPQNVWAPPQWAGFGDYDAAQIREDLERARSAFIDAQWDDAQQRDRERFRQLVNQTYGQLTEQFGAQLTNEVFGPPLEDMTVTEESDLPDMATDDSERF